MRVVLISPQPVLLDGIGCWLAQRDDYTVVGCADSHHGAIHLVSSHEPDLVILDPGDGEDGLNLMMSILSLPSRLKLVIFTTGNRVETATRALDAGAAAYLTSTSTGAELLQAIRTAMTGEVYISPAVASRMIASLRNAAFTRTATQKLKLTVREEQIVSLLQTGKTNREIGAALGLSEKTVKHYMTVLMQKMAARSRLEVVLALKELDRIALLSGETPQRVGLTVRT
jgi:DNA-binding NarL/FixJ family response regulator